MRFHGSESYNDYSKKAQQLKYLNCQLKSMFYIKENKENTETIQTIFGVVIDDFSIEMQIALLKSIVEKDTMTDDEQKMVERFHRYRHGGLM